MRSARFLTTALAGLALAGAGMLQAADWPQLRGLNRDGVSRERILTAWPEGGPRVLWKAPVGEGFSGMAVAGGRLYTLYGRGSAEVAAAFDAATGKPLWRTNVDTKLESDMGNGPRSTPVVHGDLVYVLSGKGKLHALSVATGKPAWSHDLRAELGARPPQWGVSTSPLVEGNLLLVDVGGSSGKSIAAFDKKTGRVAWTSQSDRAGYSAPIALTVNGVRQVVFFTGTSLAAFRPADGRLFWRVPWRTDYDVNAATPIFVAPDKLFVSSGYDTGAGLFRIKAGGGRATVEEVWTSRKMKNEFSSSVLHGGHIYGFDKATFKCIEAATGKEVWKYRQGLGHGSLILAGGHLIVLSDRGELLLAPVTPQGFQPKARFQALTGKCWTAPTLANGRLYVRNEQEMIAFDVAPPRAAAAKPAAKGR